MYVCACMYVDMCLHVFVGVCVCGVEDKKRRGRRGEEGGEGGRRGEEGRDVKDTTL